MPQNSCEFSGAVLQQIGMDGFLSFKKLPVPWNPEKCNILMIIFDHWDRNLSCWASCARVCWRAPVQYLSELRLFDPEIEILIRKWFQKALCTDALVLCVPCRRSSREAVFLHICAVTGMHFPNHLTSRAYLCFERLDLDFNFLVAAVLHKLGSVWSRALWHLPLCFCSCFDSLRGFFRPFFCLFVSSL